METQPLPSLCPALLPPPSSVPAGKRAVDTDPRRVTARCCYTAVRRPFHLATAYWLHRGGGFVSGCLAKTADGDGIIVNSTRCKRMSKTLTVEYPDRLPDALNMSTTDFEREARMAMAAKMFELGWITSGQAARMVGMERVPFLLSLHRYKVSMINLDEDELKEEFANARQIFASARDQ
jgi:predicted HTH domain antitoxin